MPAEHTDILFSGKPSALTGVSNFSELLSGCPEEFDYDNPWSEYVQGLLMCPINTSHWQWKSDDETAKKYQLELLDSLLATTSIKHEHKLAVAGWMLSEMLTEVPVDENED